LICPRSGPQPCVAAALAALAAGIALCLQGCITVTHYRTNSERSATEQLLVTTATDRAIMALTWPAVSGRPVSVQVASPASDDAPYLKAAVEAWLGQLGARIVGPGDEAETVSVLAGAIGTADMHFGLGIPSIPTPFGVTPPLYVLAYDRQRGYAKLRVAVRDASGATLGASPPALGRAYRSSFWILFVTFHRDDISEKGEAP
jgi:hypothetical protein